jgi:hypothetical protein
MIAVMTHNGVVAAGGRLTGWISLGVLACAVPRDAVHEAIVAAGKAAKRSDGKLPLPRRSDTPWLL